MTGIPLLTETLAWGSEGFSYQGCGGGMHAAGMAWRSLGIPIPVALLDSPFSRHLPVLDPRLERKLKVLPGTGILTQMESRHYK